VEERNASVLQPNPGAAERDAATVSTEQMPAGRFLPPPAQQLTERRGTNRAMFFTRNHPFKQHHEQIALILTNAPLPECWGGQPGRALSHEVIYEAPRQ